jgi:hypothetical protein
MSASFAVRPSLSSDKDAARVTRSGNAAGQWHAAACIQPILQFGRLLEPLAVEDRRVGFAVLAVLRVQTTKAAAMQTGRSCSAAGVNLRECLMGLIPCGFRDGWLAQCQSASPRRTGALQRSAATFSNNLASPPANAETQAETSAPPGCNTGQGLPSAMRAGRRRPRRDGRAVGHIRAGSTRSPCLKPLVVLAGRFQA